jgi:hypothetical protein
MSYYISLLYHIALDSSTYIFIFFQKKEAASIDVLCASSFTYLLSAAKLTIVWGIGASA